MWYPKPEIPESLTHHFILENAEYSIESQSKNWKVWVWHEIVLVKISGVSNPGLYPYHFSDFWDIFSERKDYWNRIYFIVDVNNMPVQSEEFLRYVKKNWQNLIERDDFCLCIVESKATKRTIWTSTFRLLGIQEKIHLFENHDQALSWEKSRTESIPEKLTLEWLKEHAQIQFGGEGLRWTLLAWQNVIYIQIDYDWKPEEMDSYVDNLSGLPDMLPKLSKRWDAIFLVFDISRMKFKKEDASRYLRSNWLKFLDREDMKVCIVEESKMRRVLLRSLYRIIGKLDRIKLFPDCDEAFGWVREKILSHKTITNE